QASGRLVRGGVPFHCFFVDASWAPRSAAFIASRSHSESPTEDVDMDNPTTSLLSAMIACLLNYTEHPIGKQLYEPFEGLLDMVDFWHNPYNEESKMIDPQIFLARFRPNLAELGKLKIYALDFPYFGIIGDFLDELVQLNPERKKQKYPFTWDERPPFLQLNGVLVATSPTLVHAFEEYS